MTIARDALDITVQGPPALPPLWDLTTSLYRNPSKHGNSLDRETPHTAPPPTHTHSWTWDLIVLGTPLLLLTSGRHRLRPVQTCSLQDRRADIWWVLKHSQLVRADGLHPTGMLSCCSMFSTRVKTADKKDRNEEGKDENGL